MSNTESIITIPGSQRLDGIIDISTSKNSTLPILAATLLCDEDITLRRLPHLLDTNSMLELLIHLGSKICVKNKDNIKINNSFIKNLYAPHELVSKMRASILILGPMLTRYKQISIAYPGGCIIGQRPIDIHLKALKKMSAIIELENGYIHAQAPNGLKGADIHFSKPSVGATEQIMMAACLAKGETNIFNAAMEPEIIDLANFLNKMGARIKNAGHNTINITGVDSLQTTDYTPIPDRLEAATFMAAAMVNKGRVLLKNVDHSHLKIVLDKLKEAGANIKIGSDEIELEIKSRPNAIDITTGPYPAFPTDLQPIFMIINAVANGRSFIKETVFENRFTHVPELFKMRSNIVVEHQTAFCTGVSHLDGTNVTGHNLRATAALVIAGINAAGRTIVRGIEHLDRGYEYIDKKFACANVHIERSIIRTEDYAKNKVY